MPPPSFLPICKGGGERGIRTLDTGFPVYSLSRRAPSTYSAISPEQNCNYSLLKKIIGGRGRIRTHVTFVKRFSRPPPSTSRPLFRKIDQLLAVIFSSPPM